MVGAALLLAGFLLVAWKIFMQPQNIPTAPAPAGANPRTQDAPEFAPREAGGDARPPGLPANAP